MLATQQDYRILGYFKENSYDNKGDLTAVDFYKNYDEATKVFSNLKVKETRTCTRDAVSGLPTKRSTLIEWFVGASVEATKTIERIYDAQEGYGLNINSRKKLLRDGSLYLFSQLAQTSADIAGVNTGTKVFTITGDLVADIEIDKMGEVKDSTGNDGNYTMNAKVLNGADTDVTVNEAIPDATADGNFNFISVVGDANVREFFGDVVTQVTQYEGNVIEPLVEAIAASGRAYMTPTIKGTLDAILNIPYTT